MCLRSLCSAAVKGQSGTILQQAPEVEDHPEVNAAEEEAALEAAEVGSAQQDVENGEATPGQEGEITGREQVMQGELLLQRLSIHYHNTIVIYRPQHLTHQWLLTSEPTA